MQRDIESPYAWWRLAAALALMTIGGAGMYAMAVALPVVQAEFNIARGDASLPYTLTMIAFGLGGVVMGRFADRYGAMATVLVGAAGSGAGFIASGFAGNLWQFSLAQAVLIGFFGIASTFAPLVADIGQWFERRRGIAVSIVMCGNYLAGALWPPIMQHFFETAGWRNTLVGVGVFVLVGTGVFVLVGCGVSVAWAAPSVPSKQSPGFVRTGLQLITSETRSSKMLTSISVSAVEPPL